MRNPLVSCICPTYSRPRFLVQTVEYFLRQRWRNAELIILDDSPSDLQAPLRMYPRVRVKRFSDRLPMGLKHNIGLEMAQGDFIAHWDDDDWQSSMRLMRQVETLLLEPVDVCGYATNLLMTDGDGKFWRFLRGKRKTLVGNAMIAVNVPFMDGTAMFKRSVVGEMQYPTIEVGQKVVFLEGLERAGAKLKGMPNEDMYVYVRHGVNTWQYRNDRRLTPVERPTWFPPQDLAFYRGAA